METAPDPGQATSLDELIAQLRGLKVWAGSPSYDVITRQVNQHWKLSGRPAGELTRRSTVADCFRPGRRRVNAELVVAIAEVLNPDRGYVTQWRQALRVVVGEQPAAAQVRVQDTLPDDLISFTGRAAEVDRIRDALSRSADGTAALCVIEGMPGVGKSQLAIHAAHELSPTFDQILFVNLRGFYPDPTQPPAEPAAVLDGFLRLLGVPGQKVPPDLDARTALYRERLGDRRALVILDNAATEDQVRPLLPVATGSLALVTSRRSLGALGGSHQVLNVFSRDEAADFLLGALPAVPTGLDRNAVARIADRCGHLPLALGLVAGFIAAAPGWTLTDHADRLDERAARLRIESGIELSLDVSYQHLRAEQRQLLRLAALHPGQEVDAFAAAALLDSDLPSAEAQLKQLHRDHLLQQRATGRYTFHDLVRAYAAVRAGDEDRPAVRRTALTRLFDYYLATSVTAMDILEPMDATRRPPSSSSSPAPPLVDLSDSRRWLGSELPSLVAVATYAADQGWESHAVRLSRVLSRHLMGKYTEAFTVHEHALRAAERSGDGEGVAFALANIGVTYAMRGDLPSAISCHQRALTAFQQVGERHGEAHALNNLGTEHTMLGRLDEAVPYHERALTLFRELADASGEGRTLTNLANIEKRQGRYEQAATWYSLALQVHRRNAEDSSGQATALNNLGVISERLGRYDESVDQHEQALALYRRTGNRVGEARALHGLGVVELRREGLGKAREALDAALDLYRQTGGRPGEASSLDMLGEVFRAYGELDKAVEHHREGLRIFREIASPTGEASALNGLGEAAQAGGWFAEAAAEHAAALAVAVGCGEAGEEARAEAGLSRAHRSLGNLARADRHHHRAHSLYTEVGIPQPDLRQ